MDVVQDRAESAARSAGKLEARVPSTFMMDHNLLLGRESVLLRVRAIELCSLDDYVLA